MNLKIIDYFKKMCYEFFFLGFSKRGVSSVESYYNLLHQLKRGMIKQNIKNKQKVHNHPDAAYYDPKNGIYY